MSVLKLPKRLCEKFSKLATSFWWNEGENKRKIHWVKREIIQKEKKKGGLGFRCFESVNDAMLMKQVWRTLKYPDLLVSKMLKAKYLDRSEGIAIVRPSDSFFWKSFSSVIDLFMKGAEYDDANHCWRWKLTSSGSYSVKSGYNLAYQWNVELKSNMGESSNTEQSSMFWTKLWRANVPERIKCVAWRLFYDALPVFESLRRRIGDIQGHCLFCGLAPESSYHLFAECQWVKSFWSLLGFQDGPWDPSSSIQNWLWQGIMGNDSEVIRKLMVGIWVIWNNRCRAAFNNPPWSIRQCIIKSRCFVRQVETRSLLGSASMNGLMQASDNTLVIQCDGSFVKESGEAGYATIALYQNAVVACSMDFLWCSSALEAEVSGIVAGILLAEKLGHSAAFILSDCVEAIWVLQSGVCNGVDGDVLLQVQKGMELLGKNKNWILKHAFREELSTVDKIAKKVRAERVGWQRIDAIPIWLGSFLTPS